MGSGTFVPGMLKGSRPAKCTEMVNAGQENCLFLNILRRLCEEFLLGRKLESFHSKEVKGELFDLTG